MSDDELDHVPKLGEPEIRGDHAERRGLVWAGDDAAHTAETGYAARQRLLVPEQWVDDAVRRALAENCEQIADSVKAELREKTRDLKGSSE